MLSEDTIDNLVQPIVDRQESVNMYVINKIANRLRDVKTLRPSDIRSLKNIAMTGADIREINAELARQSNLQVRDIKRTIKLAGANTYKDMKPFYDYRHKRYIPYEKNEKMQKLVSGIAEQTGESYKNLSNSNATGFLLRDKNNPLQTHFYTVKDTYRRVIDEAVQASLSGVVNTEEAITRALKQLLDSGMRRIYWDSGYNQRLDTAVRRNVLDGIRQVRQKVSDKAGEEFGANGKELSAHPNSAPDHEPFQGHILTNQQWENLQSSNAFTDINGEYFSGVDRIIGAWNCHHVAKSIIIESYTPRYTPEQLQKFIQMNHEGYTMPDGKHLTLYECTQMQRRLETRIRYAKEEQMAMKELGNDEAKKLARAKVERYTAEYKLFSKACGLKPKMKRASVPEYTVN